VVGAIVPPNPKLVPVDAGCVAAPNPENKDGAEGKDVGAGAPEWQKQPNRNQIFCREDMIMVYQCFPGRSFGSFPLVIGLVSTNPGADATKNSDSLEIYF
jgi:hypothetical protein